VTTSHVLSAPAARLTDPLAAVRAALLAQATADAQRVVAAAQAETAETLRAAEDRAATIRDTAAAEAAVDAAAIAAEARAKTRRAERAIVLAAQKAAYEQLRTRARMAVRGLRSDPGYPELLTRLRDVARDRLGPAAAVEEDSGGGIVAVCAGRRLSLTLDAAADRAVDALTDEAAELWQP
jgi:vacuolar-type H+-ATPase subunit E/Vma4